MAVKDNEQLITIGSKYRIMSIGGKDDTMTSTGEFRGYAAFANETALVLKLDASDGQEEGRIRFLPYRAVMCIDVLEMASKEVKEKKEDNQVYYR
ncbi:MAG: hypothetical protein GXX95_08745 [Methanomassiliicoccus sp.]|jgi:hypothetical protein|nr:hypothetical protein [Methanomassiliicoccus sp.]